MKQTNVILILKAKENSFLGAYCFYVGSVKNVMHVLKHSYGTYEEAYSLIRRGDISFLAGNVENCGFYHYGGDKNLLYCWHGMSIKEITVMKSSSTSVILLYDNGWKYITANEPVENFRSIRL